MRSNRNRILFPILGLFFSFFMVLEVQANIGIAKDATETGRSVRMDLYIENLHSTDVLSNIVVTDDLDLVYGAGNYLITQQPTIASGAATLTLNSNYDGSTDSNITSGGTLQVGETTHIQLTIQISTPSDQGFGLGIYSNQASVNAEGPLSTPYSDLSDDGTNPDPNGNGDPDDAGEDDPTEIDIIQNPIIGVAKNATVNDNQVTLDFYLENFGNRTLSMLSLVDNLDVVFGAGNYSVSSAPQLIDDPTTITLNAGFNGSSDTELITSGTLAINTTAQIQIVVDVPGGGSFSNQVSASGQSPLGKVSTDLSDKGTDPDPDGNGTPGGVGESDATTFTMGENAVIGVAKQVAVNGSVLTIDLYLENLGNVTLSNVSLMDNLNTSLGAGNFYVSSAPTFSDDPGTLTLNLGFNGNSDTELLASGTFLAGDTAHISMQVTVLTIADLGSGTGNYENQAFASAQAPGGGITQDSSDDGSDPDPNGNGNPNEAGENDISSFSLAEISVIGIAKEYVSGGLSGGFPVIDLKYTLKNYGNTTISNLTIDEDLNAVYGAGNYIHLQDPIHVSGASTLNYNSAFNGSTNTALLSGSSYLAPGEQVTFHIKSILASISNQGHGNGIYHNQVTVIGTDPGAGPVSDLSHTGNDPDPNGNGDPTEAGENDVTIIDVNRTEGVGIAKTVSVAVNLVTINFYLENLGDTELREVNFRDDLDALFGSGNYVVETPPSFIVDPGTLTLNPAYDGSSEKDLLMVTSSTLSAADTAQIQMAVRVSQVSNQQGLGAGNYSNQVTIDATSEFGGVVSDISDNGTDPDPNGNGVANDAGEDDASTFSISADSLIGLAKTASLAGFEITFDLYLENLGTDTLTSVSLVDDLDAVFGNGNYSIQSMPNLIVDPTTLDLNPNYDGSSETDMLLGSSTLAAGETAQIQVVVLITTESDQGNGFGTYTNQASASGLLSNGVSVSDLSDNGTDPDPNGNDTPSDAGEDEITSFGLVGNPVIGVAKKAYISGDIITFDFFVENLGDVTLTTIRLQDQLNPIFGAGNYAVISQPTHIAGANTLSLNFSYSGTFGRDYPITGGYLRPGESEQFRVQIRLDTVTDQGYGLGVYQNSVTVSGNAPDGSEVTDVSDDGIDPDPNGNGDPTESGEGDPTIITYGDEAILGLAKDVSISNQQVTFDLYLENLANSVLSTISIIDNLDDVFGAGNYSINTLPVFVDDPGTITLNTNYDGSSDTELISTTPSPTLVALDTAHIRFIVDVNDIIDQGIGFGNFQNQAKLSAMAPLGSTIIELSDFGTDPDPNGNGLPNDADESDMTTFIVQPANSPLGVALNASVSGRQVTLDYYIRNLGSKVLNDISLVNNLDAIFGAGNYTIVSGPTRISTPRDLQPNSGFDGSTTTQLIAANSSIGNGVTEQIQIVIEVSKLTDPGSGLGVYANQVTASGVNLDTSISQDLSDSGTDVDANNDGDPSNTGEDDPTVFTMTQDPVIGAAKTISVNGRTVTIDIFIESFANTELSNLSLTENLNNVFGSGNYSISSAPVLIVDPGTLNLNAGFDGGSSADILAAGSTLTLDASAQIRLSVSVNNVTNQGGGLGNYQNQVLISAQSPNATPADDLSDNGSDPDPNGNANPSDTDENDASPIVLEGSIGDFVWDDLNGNGTQDVGEPGISNVTVFLDANSNGVLDAGETNSVTDGSGAYQFTNLNAATYRVDIDASTLASSFNLITANLPLTINLTAGEEFDSADFGYQKQDASIGDVVWNDLNGDGIQDVGEPGLSGVTVYLDDNSNGILDGGESSTVTNGSGAYQFSNLPAGNYSIEINTSSVPSGFNLVTANLPLIINLTTSEAFNTGDFGYQQQNASIGNFVWNDLNGDQIQDAGEPGISGVTVYLDLNNNSILDSGEPNIATDGSGAYQFTNLAAGTYRVAIDNLTTPVNFNLVTANLPLTKVLTAGEAFADADFGYQQQNASIGDFVWNDLNGDQIQDAGEPGISGVTVYLDLNSNNILDSGEPSIATDGSGAYQFTNLAAGTYRVAIDNLTIPANFHLSTANLPLTKVLTVGEPFADADFGYQLQNASIGDLVWNDVNADGVQDGGIETGIDGVSIDLYRDVNGDGLLDIGDTLLDTQTTAGGGVYDFTGLAMGDYIVDVTNVGSALNSRVLTTSNEPYAKTLSMGENDDAADFGFLTVSGGGGGGGDDGPETSTETVTSGSLTAVVQVTGQTLSQVTLSDKPTDTSKGIQFPFGVLSFNVTSSPGGTAVVKINYSEDLPNDGFFLYKVDQAGNTRLIPDNLWKQLGNMSIQLVLQDGGPFDLDGEENGIIVDPVALGVTTSEGLEEFTFSSSDNASFDQWVSSQLVNIKGLAQISTLSVEGGFVSIDRGEYTLGPVTIGLGQTVQVLVKSSAEPLTSTTASIHLDDYSTTYTVTTASIALNDLFQYGQSCSAESVLDVIKAYIAHYNRPADIGGLNYWSCEIDSQDGNLDSILFSFMNTPEFIAQYAGLNDSEIIDKFYQQLFKRDPDSEGKSFWLNALLDGSTSYDHIAMALINGTRGQDTIIVNNKISVAEYFIEQSGKNGINTIGFLNVLDQVDEQQSSVDSAKLSIDQFIEHILSLDNLPQNSLFD